MEDGEIVDDETQSDEGLMERVINPLHEELDYEDDLPHSSSIAVKEKEVDGQQSNRRDDAQIKDHQSRSANMIEADDEKEDGEIDDEPSTTEPSSVSHVGPPRKLCHFYKLGKCTWGRLCKFLHPGINDTGAYQLFPEPNYSSYNHNESSPVTMKIHNATTDPSKHLDSSQVKPPKPDVWSIESVYPPTSAESAWEQGLRQAQQMRERAEARRREDKNFAEKRLTLKVSDALANAIEEGDDDSFIYGSSPPLTIINPINLRRPHHIHIPPSASYMNENFQMRGTGDRYFHQNAIPHHFGPGRSNVYMHNHRNFGAPFHVQQSGFCHHHQMDFENEHHSRSPYGMYHREYRRHASNERPNFQYARGASYSSRRRPFAYNRQRDFQQRRRRHSFVSGDPEWHDPWNRRQTIARHKRRPSSESSESCRTSRSRTSSPHSESSYTRSGSSRRSSLKRLYLRRRRSPSVRRSPISSRNDFVHSYHAPPPGLKSVVIPAEALQRKDSLNRLSTSDETKLKSLSLISIDSETPASSNNNNNCNRFRPGRQISSHTLKKAERERKKEEVERKYSSENRSVSRHSSRSLSSFSCSDSSTSTGFLSGDDDIPRMPTTIGAQAAATRLANSKLRSQALSADPDHPDTLKPEQLNLSQDLHEVNKEKANSPRLINVSVDSIKKKNKIKRSESFHLTETLSEKEMLLKELKVIEDEIACRRKRKKRLMDPVAPPVPTTISSCSAIVDNRLNHLN